MKNYVVYKRLLKKPSNLIGETIRNGIIILAEDLNNIEETLEVQTNQRKIELPLTILEELLDDKTKYKLIEKFLRSKNKKSIAMFTIDSDGKCERVANFSKVGIVNTILKSLTLGRKSKEISPEQIEKYYKLADLISYQKFLKEKGEETVSYKSYRGDYILKKSDVMRILSLPKEELNSLLDNDTIIGIPAPEFLECTHCAFEHGIELKNYIMPTQIIENNLLIDEKIDNEVMCFNINEPPKFSNDIVVNEMLWEEIWDKVPEEFNQLEKAYYIYNELCKIFTFDEETFVNSDENKSSISHNIERLIFVNNLNAEVLCYEFAAIYSKFLEELKLPYNIVGCNTYGPDHVYIEFAYKNFYVIADSTKTLINSDLSLAKRAKKLEGFCLASSHNLKTKQEFEKELRNVREYIQNEKKKKIDLLVDEYNKYSAKNITFLSPTERKDIFLQSVKHTELKPTDAMGYILDIQNILFSQEYKNKISTCFIRDNNPPTFRDKSTTLAAAICFNEDNINNEQNEYFLYRPGIGVEQITKEGLENKFLSKEVSVINNGYSTIKIPGIKTGGENNASASSHISR